MKPHTLKIPLHQTKCENLFGHPWDIRQPLRQSSISVLPLPLVELSLLQFIARSTAFAYLSSLLANTTYYGGMRRKECVGLDFGVIVAGSAYPPGFKAKCSYPRWTCRTYFLHASTIIPIYSAHFSSFAFLVQLPSAPPPNPIPTYPSHHPSTLALCLVNTSPQFISLYFSFIPSHENSSVLRTPWWKIRCL